MSLAQGWFHSGVLLWPLWCPPDPPCPQHCVATFRRIAGKKSTEPRIDPGIRPGGVPLARKLRRPGRCAGACGTTCVFVGNTRLWSQGPCQKLPGTIGLGESSEPGQLALERVAPLLGGPEFGVEWKPIPTTGFLCSVYKTQARALGKGRLIDTAQ